MTASAHRYNERTPGTGDDLFATVAVALGKIAEAPARWPLAPFIDPAHGVHRYLLKRFPFGILYRIPSDDEIEILAIGHFKRHPRYWIKRLQPPTP